MVIADDESITRQGIRESVNWELMDVEIAGEASNGLEAMLLIHDVHPDIVICDIRMPKLDGISLINELQPSCPDMQVLFLSGYSDKEYLKNAIRLDAVDYIFKPFQISELTAAVEKAKKNCQKRRQSPAPQDADAALSLLGNPSEELWERLPIRRDGSLVSILIRLEERAAQSQGSPLFDAQLAAGRCCGYFQKTADEIFAGKQVLSRVGAGYVIHANVPPDFFSGENAAVMLKRLCALPGGEAESGLVCVGVGSAAPSLRESYAQAREAARASFLLGCGRVILYQRLSKEPFSPFPDLQEGFYDCITGNRITAALSYLENYMAYMSRCRPQDIPQMKDVLTSAAFWLNERMREFSASESYVADRISFAADLGEIRDYFKQQIDQYVNKVSDLDNKGRILLEVERYILQNYDKDLSIKTIAQQVYITPNYLCYLYKKKTKRTLNQFILDVKMDKARKLICETNLRLGEISDALGYANQNYFTRIFTQYFGMSPRAYRNGGASRREEDAASQSPGSGPSA